MGDIMKSIDFKSLILRMMKEYSVNKTIFGISDKNFFKRGDERVTSIFSEKCSMPLGPAAGPHTQLSQNIVASYLTGSRFLELKTVQLKSPHVSKPCIDPRDECFNVEWSSEYEVEEAYDEYANGWIALYFLENMFDLGNKQLDKSFIFNMSVGYDMEGIKNKKVDDYINNLRDSSNNEAFKKSLQILEELIEGDELKEILKNTDLKNKLPSLKGLSKKISPNICSAITLSTMHGCPPAEIEKIVSYMLTEKKIDTYVKLNPTLLGYDTVRSVLDKISFNYIELNKDSFSHDLQYKDALTMIGRIKDLAKNNGRQLGVKLTNTLGNVNDKDVLPGDERYMSGRSLYPLSISVAAMISKDFNGEIPISYSGGLTIYNAKQIFETGIKPLTLATDLLKPGGYNRLNQIAKEIESSDKWDMNTIDVDKLSKLASEAANEVYSQKSFRGYNNSDVKQPLPLTDCAIAPCVVECPIHQPIPEYINLVGEGKFDEALDMITQGNLLPAITGYICDHKCQSKCSRLDYEGAISIRDIKYLAVEKGKRPSYKSSKGNGIKVLVIGAGPAGLSTAAMLQRNGFEVTVKEREASAGGVVKHVIPQFRIPEAVIESDVASIKELGVKFEFNVDIKTNVNDFKKEGFKYICIATGADEGKSFKLDGDNKNIIDAMTYLSQYNKNASSMSLGKNVAVVGGGNTAMDAARSAKKVNGVEEVSIIYRRTEHEMPSDEEEILLAKEDKVNFYTLSHPYKFNADGILLCKKMKLGEKDASGRRSPIETDETFELKIDTLILSLGYGTSDKDFTEKGIDRKPTFDTNLDNVYIVGDMRTGPSSIVGCIADGTEAAYNICKKENSSFVPTQYSNKEESIDKIIEKNNDIRKNLHVNKNTDIAKIEAARCLNCSKVCSKCVDVCPNRANVSIKVSGFDNYYQIIHIDDYCNECGNCGAFCPWQGLPYKDKITVFSNKKDFTDSENNGFFIDGNTVHLRYNKKVEDKQLDGDKIKDFSNTEEEIKFNKIFSSIVNEFTYVL